MNQVAQRLLTALVHLKCYELPVPANRTTKFRVFRHYDRAEDRYLFLSPTGVLRVGRNWSRAIAAHKDRLHLLQVAEDLEKAS